MVDDIKIRIGLINGLGAASTQNKNLCNADKKSFINGLSDSHINRNLNKLRCSKKSKCNIKLSASIFIIITLIFLSQFTIDDNLRFSIDGEFDEWIGMQNFEFMELNVSFEIFETGAFVYLNCPNIFSRRGNITSSYYIFIDDNTDDSGYKLNGGTYEYYIDIYGVNDNINPIYLYTYDYNDNGTNWAGFRRQSIVRSAYKNGELEFKLSSFTLNNMDFKNTTFYIVKFDEFGSQYKFGTFGNAYSIYNQNTISTLSDKYIIENDDLLSAVQIKINDTNSVVSYQTTFDISNIIPYDIRVIKESNLNVEPIDEINQPNDIIEGSHSSQVEYRGKNVSNIVEFSIEYSDNYTSTTSVYGGYISRDIHCERFILYDDGITIESNHNGCISGVGVKFNNNRSFIFVEELYIETRGGLEYEVFDIAEFNLGVSVYIIIPIVLSLITRKYRGCRK